MIKETPYGYEINLLARIGYANFGVEWNFYITLFGTIELVSGHKVYGIVIHNNCEVLWYYFLHTGR